MKTYKLNKIPTFKTKTKNQNYQSQSKQIFNFLNQNKESKLNKILKF